MELVEGMLSQMSVAAIAIFDADLRCRYANQAMATVNRRSESDHVGLSVDAVAPVVSAQIEPLLRRALAGEPTLQVHFSDAELDVVYDVVPVVKGAAVILLDVTESRRAERTYSASLRSARLLSYLSAEFLAVRPENLDGALDRALAELTESLGMSRVSLVLVEKGVARVSHQYRADGEDATLDELQPALLARAMAGETLVVSGSLIWAPMKVGDDVLGFVVFSSLPRDELLPDQRVSVQLAAEILAGAVHRQRVDGELHDRLRFEELLATQSTALMQADDADLDDMVVGALKAVAELEGFERVNILFVDGSTDTFEMSYEWCAPAVPSMTLAPVPVSEYGWPVPLVLAGQTITMSPNALREDSARDYLTRTGVERAVIVPLAVAGKVAGMMCFQSFVKGRDDGPFAPRLQLVAEMLANGIVRRRAAAWLRESELRFTEVLDSALDGVVLTDADGAIFEWTGQAESVFGWTRAEVIGRNLETLVTPGVVERVLDLAGVERLRAAGTRRLELTARHKNGADVPIELSLSTLPHAGRTSVVVFARDIAERRRAEEDRQHAFDQIRRLKGMVERERDYLREELRQDPRYGDIIGHSVGLSQVLDVVDAVAATTAAVMIRGESGVGKELFARAVHARSLRADAALVKVNCASVPKTLFESELFGHARGAFTGAHKDRAGRFELADRGTLFLDEIGEIPLELQAKLLRVLQEGELERVGDDHTRRVDVRIVCATNRDIEGEVKAGRFRQDLYYRLSVFPIEVPSLRSRREDIEPLARHFLTVYAKQHARPSLAFSDAQRQMLEAYDWPGNIRELQHVIERAVILSRGGSLSLSLSLNIALPNVVHQPGRILTDAELRQLERENLVAVLAKAAWRIAGEHGAAALLGVRPSTLRDRIKAFGIERPA